MALRKRIDDLEKRISQCLHIVDIQAELLARFKEISEEIEQTRFVEYLTDEELEFLIDSAIKSEDHGLTEIQLQEIVLEFHRRSWRRQLHSVGSLDGSKALFELRETLDLVLHSD